MRHGKCFSGPSWPANTDVFPAVRRGEKPQSIAELLNQETMRESNAVEKLDSEIRWLACHTDQAHRISGEKAS